MAVGARGEPRRLLALVFAAAAGTTAVLSLDATVVLLTPVVFATAARLRVSPRPHVYACSHLANSASLLLPVSNLTNLLALQASDLSFLRFAGLMTLPWLAALAVEWSVLAGAFRGELEPVRHAPGRAQRAGRAPAVRARGARRSRSTGFVARLARRRRARLGRGGRRARALAAHAPAGARAGALERAGLPRVRARARHRRAGGEPARARRRPPTRSSRTAPGCRSCWRSPRSARSPPTSSTTCPRR